jgi:hypothetical protein
MKTRIFDIKTHENTIYENTEHAQRLFLFEAIHSSRKAMARISRIAAAVENLKSISFEKNSMLTRVVQSLPIMIESAAAEHNSLRSEIQRVSEALWESGRKFCRRISKMECKEGEDAQFFQLKTNLSNAEKKLESSQLRSDTMLIGATALCIITTALGNYHMYRSINLVLGQVKEDTHESEQLETFLEEYKSTIQTWFSELLMSLENEEEFNLYRTLYELECIKNVVQKQETHLIKVTAAVERRITKIQERSSLYKEVMVYSAVSSIFLGWNLYSGPLVGASAAVILHVAFAGAAVTTVVNAYWWAMAEAKAEDLGDCCSWALCEEYVQLCREQQSELEQSTSGIRKSLK